MINQEIVRRRLKKLDGYLKYLEKVQNHDHNKFLANTEIWASAERFLQMAIDQSMILPVIL